MRRRGRSVATTLALCCGLAGLVSTGSTVRAESPDHWNRPPQFITAPAGVWVTRPNWRLHSWEGEYCRNPTTRATWSHSTGIYNYFQSKRDYFLSLGLDEPLLEYHPDYPLVGPKRPTDRQLRGY
jgi:hypothetical protein